MIFRPELAQLVMAGDKTVTRRLPSKKRRSPWWEGGCALKVGATAAVQPGRGVPSIGRVRILDVRPTAVGAITHADARLEGFGSAEEFLRVWEEINGRIQLDQWAWRVEFVVVR